MGYKMYYFLNKSFVFLLFFLFGFLSFLFVSNFLPMRMEIVLFTHDYAVVGPFDVFSVNLHMSSNTKGRCFFMVCMVPMKEVVWKVGKDNQKYGNTSNEGDINITDCVHFQTMDLVLMQQHKRSDPMFLFVQAHNCSEDGEENTKTHTNSLTLYTLQSNTNPFILASHTLVFFYFLQWFLLNNIVQCNKK